MARERKYRTAPDLPPLSTAVGRRPQSAVSAGGAQQDREDTLVGSPLGPDRKDWHGNVMSCPEGTIPMRRVTLEDLTRFETLPDFRRRALEERAGRRGSLSPPRFRQHTGEPMPTRT